MSLYALVVLAVLPMAKGDDADFLRLIQAQVCEPHLLQAAAASDLDCDKGHVCREEEAAGHPEAAAGLDLWHTCLGSRPRRLQSLRRISDLEAFCLK